MTGYCKYCGSLIGEKDIIREHDRKTGQLLWVGCRDCNKKR
jgi:RNase P subunit RPR2